MSLIHLTDPNAWPLGTPVDALPTWEKSISQTDGGAGWMSDYWLKTVEHAAAREGTRDWQVRFVGDGLPTTFRVEAQAVLSGGSGNYIGGATQEGSERWTGFSFMSDCQHFTFPHVELLFQQFTVGATWNYSVNPTASLVIDGDGRLQWAQMSSTVVNADDYSKTFLQAARNLGGIERRWWYDVVLHQVLSSVDGAALTQLWLNDSLVINNTLANTFPTTGGARYNKFGCYATGWRSAGSAAQGLGIERKFHFGPLRIGDASSSYAEVAPRGPRPRARPAPFILLPSRFAGY